MGEELPEEQEMARGALVQFDLDVELVIYPYASGAVWYGSRLGLEQYTVLQPDGEAALYDIHAPYNESTTVIQKGLQLIGVLRRPSRFGRRQLVECGPEDVRDGDRAVLVDEEAKRLTTLRLARFMLPKYGLAATIDE